MSKLIRTFPFLLIITLVTLSQQVRATTGFELINDYISKQSNASGIYVLDKGEEALLARAWLTDHAQESIDVQYFIWSTDNIGILASEALLRAADRGVNVRVIVDDLLIDAPDDTLLALALHPNIQIKIYNPKHSVGVSFFQRLFYLFTDFQSFNQRMHDKIFVVDNKVAIIGGRNMADEYFDYDQQYNFRDRDALLLGPVAEQIKLSFNRFWNDPISVSVESRFSDAALFNLPNQQREQAKQNIYDSLHSYADSPINFEPEVRQAIANLNQRFADLADAIRWTDIEFISDMPGKNNNHQTNENSLSTSHSLHALVNNAQHTIVIQSPYLVLSDQAIELFQSALDRDVEITVSTNSMASTDNTAAFSGYRNQRSQLQNMGIKVFEYKPDPKIQYQLLERYYRLEENAPVFAIHAKTMVIDSSISYIGTFNLDPRSQNLNTEVGVIIKDKKIASQIKQTLLSDIHPDNSWASSENPDQHAPFIKKAKIQILQWLPIKDLL